MNNREIKFRAWSKEEGMSAPFGLERLNNNSTGYYADLDDGTFELDDAEFMQYTGLKDKNGKEIYEGDIVLNNDIHFEVLWKEGGFFLRGGGHDWIFLNEAQHSEVIGNIYENPQLLNS